MHRPANCNPAVVQNESIYGLECKMEWCWGPLKFFFCETELLEICQLLRRWPDFLKITPLRSDNRRIQAMARSDLRESMHVLDLEVGCNAGSTCKGSVEDGSRLTVDRSSM